MAFQRVTKHSQSMIKMAVAMAEQLDADAILLLLDGAADWRKIRVALGGYTRPTIVATDNQEDLDGADEEGLRPLALNKEKAPLLERLQHALLEGAADGLIKPNCDVVALYSGFHQGRLDSISNLQLDERMRRLTVRDLQRLESSVPLKTIKAVVDLAVQIGREGREGKRVGTMMVVGDHRKVLSKCKDLGTDPFRGYARRYRNLFDARVQEDIKEVAQMDGAFVISSDGFVERSRQRVLDTQADLQLSQGLGTRHWAAAAVSRETNAVAIVVSQSTGTVRLYQNGELVMRIEPMDKAVKWQEFNYEPPPPDDED